MTVEEDYSEPVLEGDAPSDDERYLRTDELLSLQKTPSSGRTATSCSSRPSTSPAELWLKLGWDGGGGRRRGCLGGGARRDAAIRLLRRSVECMRIVNSRSCDMLEQMSPWEYTRYIRPVLGPRQRLRLARLP